MWLKRGQCTYSTWSLGTVSLIPNRAHVCHQNHHDPCVPSKPYIIEQSSPPFHTFSFFQHVLWERKNNKLIANKSAGGFNGCGGDNMLINVSLFKGLEVEAKRNKRCLESKAKVRMTWPSHASTMPVPHSWEHRWDDPHPKTWKR